MTTKENLPENLFESLAKHELQSPNKESLLYRLQKQQNSQFDGTNYTKTMQLMYEDYYQFIKNVEDSF